MMRSIRLGVCTLVGIICEAEEAMPCPCVRHQSRVCNDGHGQELSSGICYAVPGLQHLGNSHSLVMG